MKATHLVALLLTPLLAFAQNEPTPEQIEQSKSAARKLVEELKPQQGVITLPGGAAQVTVPESLRYYGSKDAKTILEKIWGNPPSETEFLGMLLPVDRSPMDENSWGVIIDFEDAGYVKDDDAANLDYDELLQTMKAEAAESNKAREQAGYPKVGLIGWATAPHYDAAAKKIYWAKELKFDESPDHTLNYFIRVLGRRGILNLNVVAGMKQLAEVEKATPTILSAVEFTEGNRYADFKPGSDKVATYGLAGLIAGGVLAKTGVLKGIFAALLAGKKFVIIGAIALIAGLKKLFGKKEPAA
ncbi:MAG TPA: DUF2167 domain-containing protein [Chthoniobacteraceae bacterium]|nr:DUF2167 domain-containing protein [Chthoniobacteraceae bacterium]